MDRPYAILLDLSVPRWFNHWRCNEQAMAETFGGWRRQVGALNVSEVRVVAGPLPPVVEAELRALGPNPALRFFPPDDLRPTAGLQSALGEAEGKAEGGPPDTVVLLSGGHIWVEPMLDDLVARHRAGGRRVTLCPFHPGFSPIIFRRDALLALDGKIRHMERHVQCMTGGRSPGWGEDRPTIPNMNAYMRPDRPEGWAGLARIARSGEARDRWQVPKSLRAAWIAIADNYRRCLRVIDAVAPIMGARVLEVGCSPTNDTGPRLVLEDHGAESYTGINIDEVRHKWKHPRARFVTGAEPECALKPESFDVVFSIAVWEHVADPRALFERLNRLLAPGGVHYGVFEAWSSARGYHLPARAHAGVRLPPFSHLLHTPEQLREVLLAGGRDEATAAAAIDRIFRDPYINRVRAREFLEIITGSGLEVVLLDGRAGGRYHPCAHGAAEALGGRYTPEELSIAGFEFLLRRSAYRLRETR